MKKIILIICSILINITIVYAETLESIDLPYYVKIIDISKRTEQIINLKKVYDVDTLNVVFNINFYNYNIGNNFTKYSEYNQNIWTRSEDFSKEFLSIVYYGYNLQPTDLNYAITQAVIWHRYYAWNVTFVDNLGNQIPEYQTLFNQLFDLVSNHNQLPDFFNQSYESTLWQKQQFTYPFDSIILDEPLNNNFIIETINNTLFITPLKYGEFTLKFNKKYEQEIYCYKNGSNIYWQNLKGPKDLEAALNYKVYAFKFHVEEEILGYNNRVGDAKINESIYEIYLDDELKVQISNREDVYLGNNEYLLKDKSLEEGFEPIQNLNFAINNDDLVLNIIKKVITKKINLAVFSDQKYYVYLKSNEELYETIDKNSSSIILPYGIYYIKDELGTYEQEIVVHNNKEEVITIKEELSKDEENSVVNVDEEEVIYENNLSIDLTPIVSEQSDLTENLVEELIEEQKEIINNPQTFDSISSYFLSGLSSVIIFCEAYILNRKYL